MRDDRSDRAPIAFSGKTVLRLGILSAILVSNTACRTAASDRDADASLRAAYAEALNPTAARVPGEMVRAIEAVVAYRMNMQKPPLTASERDISKFEVLVSVRPPFAPPGFFRLAVTAKTHGEGLRSYYYKVTRTDLVVAECTAQE